MYLCDVFILILKRVVDRRFSAERDVILLPKSKGND